MFEKLVTVIEPYGIGLVIIAGAILADWIPITNQYPVGIAVVVFGIMLMVAHVIKSWKNQKSTKQVAKKG